MHYKHDIVHPKKGVYNHVATNSKHSNTAAGVCHTIAFNSKHILRSGISTTFFRLFPPAKFHQEALRGLKKLQSLNDCHKSNELRRGGLLKGDVGFEQILQTLKEKNVVNGDFQKIFLVEVKEKIRDVDISPGVSRYLCIEKDGKEEPPIKTDPSDPTKPVRELREWIEEIFRKKLAYAMLVASVIWLIGNSLLIFLVYYPAYVNNVNVNGG